MLPAAWSIVIEPSVSRVGTRGIGAPKPSDSTDERAVAARSADGARG